MPATSRRRRPDARGQWALGRRCGVCATQPTGTISTCRRSVIKSTLRQKTLSERFRNSLVYSSALPTFFFLIALGGSGVNEQRCSRAAANSRVRHVADAPTAALSRFEPERSSGACNDRLHRQVSDYGRARAADRRGIVGHDALRCASTARQPRRQCLGSHHVL